MTVGLYARPMLHSFVLVVALGTGSPQGTFALSEAAAVVLRRQLQQMTDAAQRGDDAAVVRFMYPRVVQAMGGRAAAEQQVEAARRSLSADGAEVASVTVGDIRGCARARKQIQCVIEGAQEIRVSGGRLRAQTETLAFSSDDGKHWTFLSGGQDPATLRTMLPELDRALPIRPRAKPTFQRN